MAATVAVVLIGASQVGAGQVGTSDVKTTGPVHVVESLFAGIEPQGMALGSPEVPVTLVEYADLHGPEGIVSAIEAVLDR